MSQFEAGNLLNRIEMSQSLRGSLQRAISYAYDQFHREVTLEHLLLALVDDRDATVILEASAVNVSALLTELSDYLGRLEDRTADQQRRQPALGNDIQHIIKSAGAAAEKSKRRAVSSALVLAAIVGEGRSPSAQMLRNHGMTFESAIAALKQVNAAEPAAPVAPAATSQASASGPTQQPPGAQLSLSTLSPRPQMPAQQVDVAVGSTNSRDDGSRLQNMQAAHEIIANARERIAAARGTVAVHAEEANTRSAQPEPAIAESSRVPLVRTPVPAPPRPHDISQPSRDVPRHEAPVVQPAVNEARFQPPSASSPPISPQASPQPPQPAASPLMQPAPPRHDRADPLPQPPVYNQPPTEKPHGAMPDRYHRSSVPEYAENQSRLPQLTPAAQPIEPEKLIEFVPSKMCVGVPSTIEIRAPRARLEAWSGGYADPSGRDGQIITKAMVMRLKAPQGGFTIEIASPETQWSENSSGPLSDDVVSWRWIVTPVRRGRQPLQLNVSTRVVGRDGLAAARTLPDQSVNVRVTPHYGRLAGRLALCLFLALSGTALGYFGDRLFSLGSSMLAQVIQ